MDSRGWVGTTSKEESKAATTATVMEVTSAISNGASVRVCIGKLKKEEKATKRL